MPGGSHWMWQHGLVAAVHHRLDGAAALVDADGVVLEAGPRLLSMLDGALAPPLGQSLPALCAEEEDAARLLAACRRACTDGEVVTGLNLRMRRRAGRAAPVPLCLQPLGRGVALLGVDAPTGSAGTWSGAELDPADAERRRHLLQEHLAHRLHGPLAEVLGLSILAAGRAPPSAPSGATGVEGEDQLLELLGRQIRHVMAISDDLAALAGETVATPTERVAWLQLGHQLDRLARGYLAPVGGRSHQEIHVDAPATAWVRSHAERLRLLLSLLAEVVLSTGLDASMRCTHTEDGVEIEVAARPRAPAAGGDAVSARIADLTVVPLARDLAAALGAELRVGVDDEGRPLTRCTLPRGPGPTAPLVILWTQDPDLAQLHRALLASVGVRVEVVESLPAAALSAPDLVVVDVDSVDARGHAADHAARIWPRRALVALSSAESLQRGPWAAVVRKPMGARRAVELLGLVLV